jgi:hypothetical protein
MKKDLGDHIGKKRGWAWYEGWELIKLGWKHRSEVIETVKEVLDKFKKKDNGTN